MSCVSGRPDGGEKPASRRRLACALWTPKERAEQRRIIEDYLVWGWTYQFTENASALVVRPAWRSYSEKDPRYVEADLFEDEEARLAARALTWFRKYLSFLANEPRGSRHREKFETFVLWLNCRAHRAGHPNFNSIWDERADGDRKLARKLKRQAYRRVERAIRIVKLGLFADGVVLEPLPAYIRKKLHPHRSEC